MSAVDLLREKILNDRVIVPLVDGTGAEKKSVDLREEADTVFTVFGLPASSIVIKADKFPETRRFFKNTKGEASRADFIIISEEKTSKEKTKKWIVYIEIKKGDSSTNEKIVQQFKGAQCLMAYCTSVVENFYNIPKSKFLKLYKPRFVRIKNPNINKQRNIAKRPTRKTAKEIHDTPDKMLKITNRSKSHFTGLVYKGNDEGNDV